MILSTLILLFTLPGLETLVLTQEKGMSVKPGEHVKVSCRSDASRDWILTWYQQKPGKSPTFLLADSTRASGLPSLESSTHRRRCTLIVHFIRNSCTTALS